MASAPKSWADEAPTVLPTPTITDTGPKVVFSQLDERWRGVRLGRSTIARSGCTVVSLAAALANSGVATDPGVLARLLSENGLIDRNGRLVTSELPRVLPVYLIGRFNGPSIDAIAVGNYLASGMMVLVQLNHSAGGGRGQHWVLATAGAGDDLTVVDPAHGVSTLRTLYGELGIRSIMVLSLRR